MIVIPVIALVCLRRAEMNEHPLSISTSWNGAGENDGSTIVQQIVELGFRLVEIEYRVSEDAIPGIEDAVRAKRIGVSSIHNFSPLPRGEGPTRWGGDRLSLASPDEIERVEAVALTLRSLKLARRLAAGALILHMGEVKVGRNYFKELSEIVREHGVNSPQAARLRESLTAERSKRRGVYLSAAAQSLKDIMVHAEPLGVRVCVENRYYYHQIPLPGEVLELKGLVPSPMLGYWHDIGHAHVQEVLGFSSQLKSVETLAGSLYGTHIHDAEFTDDHKAPGTGEIDFEAVLSGIPHSTIGVLELASWVSEEEIRSCVRYLNRLGLDQEF